MPGFGDCDPGFGAAARAPTRVGRPDLCHSVSALLAERRQRGARRWHRTCFVPRMRLVRAGEIVRLSVTLRSVGFLLVAFAFGCGSSKQSAPAGRSDAGTGGVGGSGGGGAGKGTGGAGSGGFAGKGGGGVGGDASGGKGGAGASAGGAGGVGNASGGGGESGDGVGGDVGGMSGAGTGGMSGASAQGGGAGTPPNSEECPDAQPASMADCSTPGLSCRYDGECCPTRMTCIVNANYWFEVSECPPRCPVAVPEDGSACDACTDLPSCVYDMCGDGSGQVVTASCDASAGTWSLEGVSCEPVTCGQETCSSGQVCSLFGCDDNPCVDEPLSCSCAGSLCGGGNGYACGSTSPRRVECRCLTC
jgi:hypothetical protein